MTVYECIACDTSETRPGSAGSTNFHVEDAKAHQSKGLCISFIGLIAAAAAALVLLGGDGAMADCQALHSFDTCFAALHP